MTVIAAKWTIEEYHRMVAAGILCDRAVELLKGEISSNNFHSRSLKPSKRPAILPS